MTSLRVRLFALVAAITLLVWAGAATWTALSTRAEVQRVLDGRLVEAARMVAALDIPMRDEPRQITPSAYTRQLSCQIWSLSGHLVGRSAGAPDAPLGGGGAGFAEREIGGQQWRVYTHIDAAKGLRVMVGDNLSVRRRLVTDMMIGLLAPALAGLVALGVLLWLGVRRGLRPLDTLARGIATRSPSALAPFDEGASPVEMRPVVQEMNGLLRRLDAARRAERDFVANAAHELQTPLAGLKTQAEVARRARDAHMRDHALEQISRSVDRTSRLVRQLLNLAREESRVEDCRLPVTPVSDALAEVQEDYRAAAQAAGMDLAIGRGCACVAVPMTADALRLTIGNLVENAILYAAEGGKVRIECNAADRQTEIRVIDRGPGIAAEDRERLRRRFERGVGGNGTGSGLGLSIVEAAANAAGARLELHDAEGGGLSAAICFGPQRSTSCDS
ncbi:MAG: ATP-binding protein [Sphingobium sp.]